MNKRTATLFFVTIAIIISAIISCDSNNSTCKKVEDIDNIIDGCNIILSDNSTQGQIPNQFAIEDVCWLYSDPYILQISIAFPIAVDYKVTLLDKCSRKLESVSGSTEAGVTVEEIEVGDEIKSIYGIKVEAGDVSLIKWYKIIQ